MADVIVTITGAQKIAHAMDTLAEKSERRGLDLAEDLARFIQKSAKLRAPRFTGALAGGISIHPAKRGWVLESTAPHAAMQEGGFKPHKVHASTPTGFPGMTVRDWLESRGYHAGPGGFITVRRFKPHILPAIEAAEANFEKIAELHIKRLIQDAFG